MDYLYRILINSTFVKFFSLPHTHQLDFVFDGNNYLPYEPYPKEWTDIINDCLEDGKLENTVVFNIEKFLSLRGDRAWFRGRENLLFIIASSLNEIMSRFNNTPSSETSIQELFERIPKLKIALEHQIKIRVL